MCPKGDDPVTQFNTKPNLSIEITSISTDLSGTVAVNFQDEPVYLDLSNPSSNQCKFAFESNPKFSLVDCIFLMISSSHFQFDVTVTRWPVLPVENNVYFHEGRMLSSEFTCDSTQASPLECTFLSNNDDAEGITIPNESKFELFVIICCFSFRRICILL